MITFSLTDVLEGDMAPCEPNWTEEVVSRLGGDEIATVFQGLTLRQLHEDYDIKPSDLYWLLRHMTERPGLLDRMNVWLSECRARAGVSGNPATSVRGAQKSATKVIEAITTVNGGEMRLPEEEWQFQKLLEVFDA